MAGGGGGGGGAAPAPKHDELTPHPVKDQLPGVSYCITSPPPWRENQTPSLPNFFSARFPPPALVGVYRSLSVSGWSIAIAMVLRFLASFSRGSCFLASVVLVCVLAFTTTRGCFVAALELLLLLFLRGSG